MIELIARICRCHSLPNPFQFIIIIIIIINSSSIICTEVRYLLYRVSIMKRPDFGDILKYTKGVSGV
jgi:hypothetical protein